MLYTVIFVHEFCVHTRSLALIFQCPTQFGADSRHRHGVTRIPVYRRCFIFFIRPDRVLCASYTFTMTAFRSARLYSVHDWSYTICAPPHTTRVQQKWKTYEARLTGPTVSRSTAPTYSLRPWTTEARRIPDPPGCTLQVSMAEYI